MLKKINLIFHTQVNKSGLLKYSIGTAGILLPQGIASQLYFRVQRRIHSRIDNNDTGILSLLTELCTGTVL